jgi:hypothetical protein
MFLIGRQKPGLENPMRDRQRPPSLICRVLRLSLTWLFLGTVFGVVSRQGTGGRIEIVSMMIAGMIVLLIPGVLLGVIGGDARGSILGAAGGLLGCWLAKLGGGVTIQPSIVGVLLIFSGLLGATCFLFMRLLFWKYRIVFSSICWLIDAAPVSGKVSALAGYLHQPHAWPAIRFRARSHHLRDDFADLGE